MKMLNESIDWLVGERESSNRYVRAAAGILTFLAVFLIYGLAQFVYESSWLKDNKSHQPISITATVTDLLIMLIIGSLALYMMDYIQKNDIARVGHMNLSHGIWWTIGLWLGPIVLSVLLSLEFGIKHSSSTNESEIIGLLRGHDSGIIWIVVTSCLVAPIIEEFMFRFIWIGNRNLDNKSRHGDLRTFLIVSSIIVVVYMHMDTQLLQVDWSNNTQVVNLLIAIIEYAIDTCGLTYLFVRHNNINDSIYVHIALNTISTIIQLLIIFAT